MQTCQQCGQTRNLDSPYCAYCGSAYSGQSSGQYTPGNQPNSQYGSQPNPYGNQNQSTAPVGYQYPPNYNQYQNQGQNPVGYQPTNNPMVPPPQPGYMVPGPNMYAPPKDKVAAALLCFFLGYLGIHGFYLGNNNMGIALLVITLISTPLLCIGVGILGFFAVGVVQLIQTILYLVANDYEFQQKYVIEKRWF